MGRLRAADGSCAVALENQSTAPNVLYAMRPILLLAFALSLSACVLPPVNRSSNEPLSVRSIEIDRYAGLWYEVARFPNNFEENCEGVTAEYRKRADGRIDVINTCREGAPNGPARVAEGVARIADTETNAKLKVRFGFPIDGDYWVLDRADDYSW